MSRLASMIAWIICAAIHFSILICISPLIMQLFVLGAFEGFLGVLTWKMYRALERRTIQRVIDLAESEEQPTYLPTSAGQHV